SGPLEYWGISAIDVQFQAAPEPGALILALLGAAGLLARRGRRLRRATLALLTFGCLTASGRAEVITPMSDPATASYAETAYWGRPMWDAVTDQYRSGGLVFPVQESSNGNATTVARLGEQGPVVWVGAYRFWHYHPDIDYGVWRSDVMFHPVEVALTSRADS